MGTLTIILPAFNESENIERAISEVDGACARLGLDHEVIVVDDGSSDATGRVLAGCSDRHPAMRVLRHPRNRGYGAALKTGIESAKGDLIFFTDADLQFDVSELEILLQWADHFDIVVGYRIERADSPMRRFNAWAWGRLMVHLFALDIRDIDCAFKLFHRRVFEAVPIAAIGAFVSSEILVRAKAEGFSVFEVPVSHFPRKAGKSTGGHPRVILTAFLEVARLRKDLRRTGRNRPR